MGAENYYPIKIKRLADEYKEKINWNKAADVENLDDYELGIIEGQKDSYKEIVTSLLSILVDGMYSELEQTDYLETGRKDIGK